MLVPSGKKTPEQWPVTTAEEARVAVRELKQQGADFIKIISVPSREIFFAIAEEAKKEKIPFVGHVPLAVTASEASDAGMRSIEHIVYSNLALDCSAKEKELRAALPEARKNHDETATGRILTEAVNTYSPDKAAALWATFKKNGTWVTPTLVSIEAQTPASKNARGTGQRSAAGVRSRIPAKGMGPARSEKPNHRRKIKSGGPINMRTTRD